MIKRHYIIIRKKICQDKYKSTVWKKKIYYCYNFQDFNNFNTNNIYFVMLYFQILILKKNYKITFIQRGIFIVALF